MSNDDIYIFHINAYTPETIPMSRLAEYMAVLTDLLGEKPRVHFDRLEAGSTNIITKKIDPEALPKISENISNAQTGDDNLHVVKAYKKINAMLLNDNGDGELLRGKSNVLNFPGYKMPRLPQLGPFVQDIKKDGILVRVGGKDKSAHATIEDHEGETWNFEISRELAMELARYLFGNPIRLSGTGRFFRDHEGQWKYIPASLRATAFYPLNSDNLVTVVDKIRQLPQEGWRLGDDPIASLLFLRDGNDGVH